jgi:trigger factor
MKRKFMSVMLATAMVLSLVACGKKNNTSSDNQNNSTTNQDVSAEDYAGTIVSNADVYKQYIKLPTYTGIEVTVDRSTLEVTDDAVNDYINSILSQYADTETLTEGVTASGDVINLDYSGLLDGTAFSGGTATDVSYTIGSGKFISDLDKGLVGLTVGQQYNIPAKFPDDYSTSTLAGKDVVFVVTVNSIQKSTNPDLTDAWVAEKASEIGTDATTVEGLKQYAKDTLKTQAEQKFASSKYTSIWSKISGDITVDGYPQDELDNLISTLKNNIQSEYNQYGTYYGSTDFLSYIKSVYGFETEDDFNAYAEQYAQQYLLEKMAITIIAVEQNISVSADDITDMGQQLADYYGYESYQEILDNYGNSMNAEVGYEVLYQRVQEFINDSAVEA